MHDSKDWTALIKHNDELSQKYTLDNQVRRKERQSLYKDELDYQKSVKQS